MFSFVENVVSYLLRLTLSSHAILIFPFYLYQRLRHLLTQGGFRLPGEAQQIDRLISTFARCYWEDNAGDRENCPIENEDSIYLLSFAIIILNTDLHKSNPSSGKNRKKNQLKRMTKISKRRILVS